MKQRTVRFPSLNNAIQVVALLAIAAGTGKPALASTIDYQINNNAGMIAPFEHELVSISGQFNYDPATESIENFNITLTTHLEFSGTYTDNGTDALIPSLGQPRIVFGGTADSGVFYAIDLFLNDFGGDGAYDIRFIDATGPPNYTLLPVDAQHRPTITAVTGGEAAVPEPSTRALALTAGAFMLLSVSLRRHRTPAQ